MLWAVRIVLVLVLVLVLEYRTAVLYSEAAEQTGEMFSEWYGVQALHPRPLSPVGGEGRIGG